MNEYDEHKDLKGSGFAALNEEPMEYVYQETAGHHTFIDRTHFDGRLLARPSWDRTWMDTAEVMARRSTCTRGHTAALVVDSWNQLLTIGYNGAPRGMAHCDEVGCDVVDGHCVRALHAEQNAIINAARTGVSLLGETLVTITRPCYSCAKLVCQAGIMRIVFRDQYLSDGDEGWRAVWLLCEAMGVTLVQLRGDSYMVWDAVNSAVLVAPDKLAVYKG